MKLMSLFGICALALSTQVMAGGGDSPGCNYELKVKNSSGSKMYYKNVKYKLSGSSWEQMANHSGSKSNGGEWSRDVNNLLACADYYWKFTWKKGSNGTWHTFTSNKITHDNSDDDCNVHYTVSGGNSNDVSYDWDDS